MTSWLSRLPWPLSIPDGQNPFIPQDESPTIERRVPHVLRHYEKPGVPPPSSRVDIKSAQEPSQPLKLWQVWKYCAAAAAKGTQMTYDLISHHVWGPRRKSWGVEMTLISSFMRDGARHSKLADIATLRLLISICGLVPVPRDAMITPVTFTVRQRNLKGFLADYDAAETGKRRLSGEWIVGKRLWQKLQAEWHATRAAKKAAVRAGVDFYLPEGSKDRVILYLHGGAYFVFSAATHRLITIQLSKVVGARVFAVNYRLAPETRFPGPLHDAVVAYFRLIDDLHIPPENILIAGDSAGGGLSLALLMYLRDNGYPLPSGAILFCPWVDLTMSCDSWDSNAAYDVISIPPSTDHLNPVACYLGENIGKYLTHPYASPLFGDFRGLPPMLIQYGDAEVLRDEITLLAYKAKHAGVEVQDELYEDAVHVFHTFPFLQATCDAFESCRTFVRTTLPRQQAHSPKMLGESAQAELENEMLNDCSKLVSGDGAEVNVDEGDTQSIMTPSAPEPDPLPAGVTPTTGGGADSIPSNSNISDGESDDPSWRPITNADEVVSPDLEMGQSSTSQAQMAALPAEAVRPLRRIRSAIHSAAARLPRYHRRTPSHRVVRFGMGVGAEDDLNNNDDDERENRATSPAVPLHSRTRSGSMSSNTSSYSTLTLTPPAPQIRAGHRAQSHPDISSLCTTWTTSGR